MTEAYIFFSGLAINVKWKHQNFYSNLATDTMIVNSYGTKFLIYFILFPFFCPQLLAMRRVTSISSGTSNKDTVAGLLASLMEVVRTTVACECVYVRAMVIKALIWMQSPYESFDELGSIIASELSDPVWPAALLNDILLTLHARFKVYDDTS